MRELNEQQFCGWCGSKVVYKQDWMSECIGCGFQRFLNPSACCNAIITKGDQVLMVKRAHQPEKDRYDLPGGFMDMTDESMEFCVYREVREEVGLSDSDLDDIVYLGSGQTPPYKWFDTNIRNIAFFFTVALKSDDSAVDLDEKENSEWMWVSKEDLPNIDFAWDIDRQMLEKHFEGTANGSTDN